MQILEKYIHVNRQSLAKALKKSSSVVSLNLTVWKAMVVAGGELRRLTSADRGIASMTP